MHSASNVGEQYTKRSERTQQLQLQISFLQHNFSTRLYNASGIRMVGWLIGFYPQGPMKGIFVSSKAHTSLQTQISSDQGDLLVVRLGSQSQVTCMEGE